ncbi:hypothetical protein GTR02_03495 [Kineococcus sp. R8]|uniref:hypothetical protein n=1 Tax=Kineococcus siccus TaxID=2696567 RepID=UPI001413790E|nr:hypothetical protein [Kineococcus siccus]NAZ80882.1 hypothetical protein [Kineococcus siccus]
MLRRRFTALLGLLTAVPVALTTAAATPAAAAPAPGLRVAAATVTTYAPAETRPMVEDCFAGRSAANCGFGVVELTLTGFDAFGGVPDCAEVYTEACDLPVAEVAAAIGTRVEVVVRCGGEWLPRVRTVRVTTDPGSQQRASQVGPWNRVDSDTARISAEFTLPPPSAFGACAAGKPVTFLGAVARRVTVAWTSPAGTVPAGHATIAGVYRFAGTR